MLTFTARHVLRQYIPGFITRFTITMSVQGKLLTVLLLNLLFANNCEVLSLSVSPYGVYSDILIKISDQVPRQKCHQALDNLEVSHHPNLILYNF